MDPPNIPTLPPNLYKEQIWQNAKEQIKNATIMQNQIYSSNAGIMYNIMTNHEQIEYKILSTIYGCQVQSSRSLGVRMNDWYTRKQRHMAIKLRKVILHHVKTYPVYLNVVYVTCISQTLELSVVPVFHFKQRNEKINYIDLEGRHYSNWKKFVDENILPPSLCCYPKNGHYGQDQLNEVPNFDEDILLNLELSETRSCNPREKYLKYAQNALSVASMALMAASVTSVGLKKYVDNPTLHKWLERINPYIAAGKKTISKAVNVVTIVSTIDAIIDKANHGADFESYKAEITLAVSSILSVIKSNVEKKIFDFALGDENKISPGFEFTAILLINLFSLVRSVSSVAALVTVLYTMLQKPKDKLTNQDFFNLSSALFTCYGVLTTPLTAKKIFEKLLQKHMINQIKADFNGTAKPKPENKNVPSSPTIVAKNIEKRGRNNDEYNNNMESNSKNYQKRKMEDSNTVAGDVYSYNEKNEKRSDDCQNKAEEKRHQQTGNDNEDYETNADDDKDNSNNDPESDGDESEEKSGDENEKDKQKIVSKNGDETDLSKSNVKASESAEDLFEVEAKTNEDEQKIVSEAVDFKSSNAYISNPTNDFYEEEEDAFTFNKPILNFGDKDSSDYFAKTVTEKNVDNIDANIDFPKEPKNPSNIKNIDILTLFAFAGVSSAVVLTASQLQLLEESAQVINYCRSHMGEKYNQISQRIAAATTAMLVTAKNEQKVNEPKKWEDCVPDPSRIVQKRQQLNTQIMTINDIFQDDDQDALIKQRDETAAKIIKDKYDEVGKTAYNYYQNKIIEVFKGNENEYVLNKQLVRMMTSVEDVRTLFCEIALTETTFDVKNGILLINGQLNIDGAAFAQIGKNQPSNVVQRFKDGINLNNPQEVKKSDREKTMAETQNYQEQIKQNKVDDQETESFLNNIKFLTNAPRNGKHRLTFEVQVQQYEQWIKDKFNMTLNELLNTDQCFSADEYSRLIMQFKKYENFNDITDLIEDSIKLANYLNLASVEGYIACHQIVFNEAMNYKNESNLSTEETMTDFLGAQNGEEFPSYFKEVESMLAIAYVLLLTKINNNEPTKFDNILLNEDIRVCAAMAYAHAFTNNIKMKELTFDQKYACLVSTISQNISQSHANYQLSQDGRKWVIKN